MRRQIVKQPYLVARIQVLDCFSDFLNRAHRGNLSKLPAIKRHLGIFDGRCSRSMKQRARHEKANAQRPTLNAEATEVRLKAALRVPLGLKLVRFPPGPKEKVRSKN